MGEISLGGGGLVGRGEGAGKGGGPDVFEFAGYAVVEDEVAGYPWRMG